MPGNLQHALALIDAAHAEDPTIITIDDTPTPYELHYARKCTTYLERRVARAPNPSPAPDTLLLAVRAQHLRRWQIPRASYPQTRPGYYAWRRALQERAGEQAADMAEASGYSKEEAMRVAQLIMKVDLREDEGTQALEDVACLVFLDDQFAKFAEEHGEQKILGILRKTWGKMTRRGQEMALEIHMEGRSKELLEKALAG